MLYFRVICWWCVPGLLLSGRRLNLEKEKMVFLREGDHTKIFLTSKLQLVNISHTNQKLKGLTGNHRTRKLVAGTLGPRFAG